MSTELNGKTLILGVGAQRCGTTWLHQFLRRSESIACTPLKELHFFDAYYRSDLCGKFNARFERQHADNLEAARSGREEFDKDLAERAAMQGDFHAYLRYFERLTPSDKPLMCEITPSYALIDADGFRGIRNFMARNGIHVKVIFLMRDPADRVFSTLRKFASNRPKVDPKRDFRQHVEKKGVMERTRYDRTVTNLRSAFGPDQIFFGFYESLFNMETITALSEFLSVELPDPDFRSRPNAYPNDAKPEESDLEFMVRRLRRVYRFCDREFGERIPESWSHKRLSVPLD
ncbi:MAG: sulfotransferase [Candidatus Wenzhouxiangella sp. M2_3B_020]